MPGLYDPTITGDPDDRGLQGNLSMTTITDLLQFLASSAESGAIKIVRYPQNDEGMIYFGKGQVLSSNTSEKCGLESFAYMLNWKQGSFNFLPGSTPLETNIGL